MKTLPKDVYAFTVKVIQPSGACWKCDVDHVPGYDSRAETVEKGERIETFIGESDDYTVTVCGSCIETKVLVCDKSGKEVDDFTIEDKKSSEF